MCSWNRQSPRILTTEVNGTRRCLPVGGIPGILETDQVRQEANLSYWDLHPVHLPNVGEHENELIDDSVRSHGPTDQFQSCIVGIIENEVMEVKVTQSRSPNAASQLRPCQQ